MALTFQDVVRDPEFHALPPQERAKVLQRIDPDFAALPSAEQTKVISRLAAPGRQAEASAVEEGVKRDLGVDRPYQSRQQAAQALLRRGGSQGEARAILFPDETTSFLGGVGRSVQSGVEHLGRTVLDAYRLLDPTQASSAFEAGSAPVIAGLMGTPPVAPSIIAGETVRKGAELSGASPNVQAALGVATEFAWPGALVPKGIRGLRTRAGEPLAREGVMPSAAPDPLDAKVVEALEKSAQREAAESQAVISEVKGIIPGFTARYEEVVDKVGAAIMAKVPKVLRAGRGTPLEFRETRAQMEADIANGVEKAIELGTPLKRELSTGERLRADQLLRGGISTPGTPKKVIDFVEPARQELDRLQDELLKLGKISPESIARFENNFGKYYARLYERKELVPKDPVLPWSPPVRAGTPRLMTRGERVEVEIPSLEQEMESVARLLGPESEFRREFRQAARGLAKRKETTANENVTEKVLGEERTVKTETSTAGGEGEFTEVPLSGVAARLEKIVTDALQTRGMTPGEASAAVGRVKAAAVKASRGEDIKITAGGTTTQKTTETVKQRILREKETVKTVIENLGINNAQKAALHAYYDAVTRAGAKAKSIKVGDNTYRINPVMDIESGVERAEALKPLLDAGYTVEAREGSRVTLFRDIPEELRAAPAGSTVVRGGKELTADQLEAMVEQGIEPPKYVTDWRGRMVVGGKVETGMGEMRKDPGFVTAKSVAQINREVAVNRFFNTVSRNSEWTSDIAKPGFTQMGDSKKALGELANKFVRSDIAAELNEMTRMKGDWEKILNRVTELWKIGKVTVNPATISRNFFSSAILADFGGLSPWSRSGARSYARAVGGFIGQDADASRLLAEAKQAGLFHSNYNQAEINLLAEGFLKSTEENPLLRLLDGLKNNVVVEKVGNVYGSVDTFYKGALYVHGQRELGLSPQLAMRYAKKYGIDYSDVSPFVRRYREVALGAPFATWGSKAIPLAIETAVKHPWRAGKWLAIPYGVNEISSTWFEAEREDLKKARELGEVPSPRFALLPVKDKDGRFQFLDLGYILPFGDILEVVDRLRGGGGANISFEPAEGPIAALLDIHYNKDTFTGKPIYKSSDTVTEAGAKIANHVFKAWLPAFAPPIPGTGFTGGHSTDAFRKVLAPELQLPGEAPLSPTDYAGRRRSLGTTVASKIFGANIKSVDPSEVERFKLAEITEQVTELSTEMVKIQRSGITDQQKEAELSRIEEKIDALQKKALGLSVPQESESDIQKRIKKELRGIYKDGDMSLDEKIKAALVGSQMGGAAGALRPSTRSGNAPGRFVFERSSADDVKAALHDKNVSLEEKVRASLEEY